MYNYVVNTISCSKTQKLIRNSLISSWTVYSHPKQRTSDIFHMSHLKGDDKSYSKNFFFLISHIGRHHLSGVAREKYQKFIVLGENLQSNLKSTNYCASYCPFWLSSDKWNFYWVAFVITFRVGHVKNVRSSLCWAKIYRLT